MNEKNLLFQTKDLSAIINPEVFGVQLIAKQKGSIDIVYGQQYYLNSYLANREKRKKLYCEILEKALMSSSGPLLDVGSGAGLFLQVAAERKIEATGIEPSGPACQLAKMECPAEIIHGDPLDFSEDWRKEHYGCITILDVLAHTESPDKLLQWCGKQMNKDGILVLKTPNHPLSFYQYVWIKHHRNTSMLQELLHFPFQQFGWGINGIEDLLKKCGFNIISLEPYHEFERSGKFLYKDLLHPRRLLYKSSLRNAERFLGYPSILAIAKKRA